MSDRKLRDAAEIDRAFAEASASQKQGRLREAHALYRRIVAADPDHLEARYNCALIDFQNRNPGPAARHLEHILGTAGEHGAALALLAGVYNQLDRLDDALACADKALSSAPNDPGLANNRAVILRRMRRFDDAVEAYDRSLALAPDRPDALLNKARALRELGRGEDALDCVDRALAVRPGDASAFVVRGQVLCDRGDYDGAVAGFDAALAIDPNSAIAHYNKGIAFLLSGRLDLGWPELDWRWSIPERPRRRRRYRRPLWDGESLTGKTIFVYPEQGAGDTIQMLRYLPGLATRAERVVLEVPPVLRRLVGASTGLAAAGVGRFAAPNEPAPDFDVHATLLDLPRLAGTAVDTIPNTVPYIAVPEDVSAAWRARIERMSAGGRAVRVGIAWAGNPNHTNDHNRSIDAALLAPLAKAPGVDAFSLQVGDRAQPGLASLRSAGAEVHDLAPHFADFADTAAALEHLDLVVTVDTAVAHLAGALARPVWTLIPKICDWRWIAGRNDSPWYPTMRLYRQRDHGDWNAVVARAAADLADDAGRGRISPGPDR